MAYIEPSTVIRICNNVPMDSSYRHTILFDNESDQIAYFTSKGKFPLLQRVSYQRVSKGKLRVQLKADDLYDCNYMCFQNTNFGTKWFYAFINNVEYVNNETSEITYLIDEMQTWLFDFTIKSCFVEREHVNNDDIGEHTVDEQLPTGEYIINNTTTKTFGKGVLIQANTEDSLQGELVNGVFSAVNSAGYRCETEEEVNAVSQTVYDLETKHPEKIANIQMCSDNMLVPDTEEGNVGKLKSHDDMFSVTHNLIFSMPSVRHPLPNQQTYIPANNKLYCYPFQFLTVDNFSGNSEIYRYEDFYNPLKVDFNIHSTPLPVPTMLCSPMGFKNLTDPVQYDTLFAVQYTDFPKCAWTNSSYETWAGRAIPLTNMESEATLVKSVINVASAFGSPMNFGEVLSEGLNQGVDFAVKQASLKVEMEQQKLHSTSMGGTFSSGMNFELGNIGFRFTQYSIRPEIAEIIDNFFTKFGYKVNLIKVPNIRGRKYFNYVKTREAFITGNLPNNSKTIIQEILNNGVTFWHTTDVGNYELVNAII